MYQIAKDMGKEVVALTFDVKFGDVILYLRREPPNKGVKLSMYTDAAKTDLKDKDTWISEYKKALEAKKYTSVNAAKAANAAWDLGKIGIKSKGIKGNAIVNINGVEFPTTYKNALMMETHANVTITNPNVVSRSQLKVSMDKFKGAIVSKFEAAPKVKA